MSGEQTQYKGVLKGIDGKGLLKNAMLFGPLVGPIMSLSSALEESQKELRDAEERGTSALAEEAKRQQIMMAVQTHQAELAQELAIAQRIALSDEVEIEEFYDVSGKGGAGVQLSEGGANVGVTGEGRKVTKRVIKFRGWGGMAEAAHDDGAAAGSESKPA